MTKDGKARERNKEIVTFFYAILTSKVREGKNPDVARKEAYDAVSLRYEISRGRLLNIISENKSSRLDNNTIFRQNILSLIAELNAANAGLESMIAKNTALISMLNDCLEYER